MRTGKSGVMAAALLLAACQTWGPTWSELSGARYTSVAPDRRPAILISVGSEAIGSVTPYRVAPGTYRIVVQSPVHDKFPGSTQEMTLAIEPCQRYYINAQFEDPVRPVWKPVIDYVETIAGCTTASK
jgi:hypothetical protein